MVEETQGPNNDREAAVAEWEKHQNAPLIADDRKKKAGGIAIAVVALAVMGAIWYMKNGGTNPGHAQTDDLAIAARKPVPKLDLPTAEVSPVGGPTPAPTPVTVVNEPSRSAYSAYDAQSEQLERQRREEERRMLEARLKSAIIPQNSGQGPAYAQPGPGDGAGLLGGKENGAQDANSSFARAVSNSSVPVSKATQLQNLEYKILQGKLIDAVLEPRTSSDLPGMICATVERDVYGAQGRIALIPWGSRVCGVYNAELRKGQDRIFAVLNHLRTPSGLDIVLDSAVADQLGTVGMGGLVDTHFAEIFGMSALLAIIGAGASNTGVSGGDQYNSAAYYRQSVQQAAAQTSQQVLQPYVNIQPTIKVPQGTRIRIYVNRDLDFSDAYKQEIAAAEQGGVMFIK